MPSCSDTERPTAKKLPSATARIMTMTVKGRRSADRIKPMGDKVLVGGNAKVLMGEAHVKVASKPSGRTVTPSVKASLTRRHFAINKTGYVARALEFRTLSLTYDRRETAKRKPFSRRHLRSDAAILRLSSAWRLAILTASDNRFISHLSYVDHKAYEPDIRSLQHD